MSNEVDTLADLPGTKAFVEKMLEEKGPDYFQAVRLYLNLKEKIQSLEEGEERDAIITKSANIMAVMTALTGLDADSITKDAHELALLGISELKAAKARAADDGPETLQ